MPYKVYQSQEDGARRWCVHKEMPDGTAGERMACHDSEAKADAQIAALYANEAPTESEKPRMTKTRYFAELINLTEAALDAEGRKARVTLIAPGWSSNGRYYSRETLKAAAGLFEGVRAYRDHPGKQDGANRPERSIADLVGVYENVKVADTGAIQADFIVEDEATWNKLAFAAAHPNYLGVSINALGVTASGEAEGRKGVIVEAIEKANSVDVVTTPAAGGRIERLLMADDDSYTRDLLAAMPLVELKDTLREARPDLLDSYRKEWKVARDSEAVKSARAEGDAHKAKLAEAKGQLKAAQEKLAEVEAKFAAASKESAVDKLLSGAAHLPDKWRADLRSQLLEADPKEWAAIVEREIEKAKALASKVTAPIRGAGAIVNRPMQLASRPKVNPVAESLGVDPELARAKTFTEFMKLKEQKEGN